MSIEHTKALQDLIVAAISALGDEKAKPFEINACYEFIGTDFQSETCYPRVRIQKS